mgnify:CR=1 FL=1
MLKISFFPRQSLASNWIFLPLHLIIEFTNNFIISSPTQPIKNQSNFLPHFPLQERTKFNQRWRKMRISLWWKTFSAVAATNETFFLAISSICRGARRWSVYDWDSKHFMGNLLIFLIKIFFKNAIKLKIREKIKILIKI